MSDVILCMYDEETDWTEYDVVDDHLKVLACINSDTVDRASMLTAYGNFVHNSLLKNAKISDFAPGWLDPQGKTDAQLRSELNEQVEVDKDRKYFADHVRTIYDMAQDIRENPDFTIDERKLSRLSLMTNTDSNLFFGPDGTTEDAPIRLLSSRDTRYGVCGVEVRFAELGILGQAFASGVVLDIGVLLPEWEKKLLEKLRPRLREHEDRLREKHDAELAAANGIDPPVDPPTTSWFGWSGVTATITSVGTVWSMYTHWSYVSPFLSWDTIVTQGPRVVYFYSTIAKPLFKWIWSWIRCAGSKIGVWLRRKVHALGVWLRRKVHALSADKN
jgi:hypothetical protein